MNHFSGVINLKDFIALFKLKLSIISSFEELKKEADTYLEAMSNDYSSAQKIIDLLNSIPENFENKNIISIRNQLTF